MKRVTTIDSKNININIKSGRGKKKRNTDDDPRVDTYTTFGEVHR